MYSCSQTKKMQTISKYANICICSLPLKDLSRPLAATYDIKILIDIPIIVDCVNIITMTKCGNFHLKIELQSV